MRPAVVSSLAVTAIAALAACPSPPPPARVAAATASPPPRLVVLVVIDQLPAWAFGARAAASTDGVARLTTEGRRYTGRYPYVATQTAPGHAALGTGAPPAVTGIIGNEWWRRDDDRERKATYDPAGGRSAVALRVDGLADVLLRAHPDAHAVAVALKDRSAILSLGHAGTPIWYDDDCPCFVGQADPAPAWLDQLAADHPVAAHLDDVWTALDPARLAELSGGPDDAPGELAIPGWGSTFPHAMADVDSPAGALIDAPAGNTMVREAAEAAIDGEALGQDDVADLLVVSFSAHDYVGHAFGPDSWEAWDMWLRLDAELGALWRTLDDRVGAGRWAVVFTSDHGGPELPERRQARGLPGARFSYDVVAAAADAAIDAVAGDGDWIASARVPGIYLTAAGRALPDDVRDRALDAAAAAVAAVPGILRAGRTDLATGDCDARADDVDAAVCRSLDPERSGELWYLPAEGTVLHKADWVDAVAHGSSFAYDREVPLIVAGPGVVPGEVAGTVSTLRVAPTLAAWLGVDPPPAAREPALPLR